ncbi:uncharacterized protein L3040_007519 [Drepanopeziza brunnea f. sp. 'multigermtubi']|uniref:Uncharacterized protein n=1 Tax=Marssonina brunnea f. sp. multigermtubi (strain MB_m1) TaxID=1072389 RepID=K1X0F0_MARBU|nr:uncharacterized protein MBM_03450 [Drepanopeziza brunnea f. sp. 'multigermtubi' MB_m1]EKD18457.1 hypothetical protein MBM_03450 [Drepanopeziza brunnea f. sp. 'multigermtubi' MB_m1]KAJ5037343.1 hypothetical protein L3040_007519 [Drepanopeziza brunnea f. sp. 'multigermtubi']
MDRYQATGKIRKRKAETQDNERLSKRLSLLNLERNGEKLYVPVEQPSASTLSPFKSSPLLAAVQTGDDDTMHLDDTKHKVYIYDLDAELADGSGSESDDGKLVFLPDIQQHLRETRIPPMVFANSEGELAGANSQLVLYNVPSSLSVPAEKDSVRKAVIESRARARAALQAQKAGGEYDGDAQENASKACEARDWYPSMAGSGNPPSSIPGVPQLGEETMEDIPAMPTDMAQEAMYNDPDAMDLG